MSISSSYLSSYLFNNLYSNNNNKYSSLFSTNSTSSLNDLITKYSYMKKNYKDIKTSLKADYKDEKISTADLKKEADSLTKTIVDTRLSAGKLNDSIDALANDKLYAEGEDGSVDYDKILSAAKDFVNNYNDLKNIAGESTNDTVVRQAYYMVNTTTANKASLEKIGISIKSDNTLSIDESKLKKANVASVKSLFKGAYSLGKQVQRRANEIKSAPNGGYVANTNKAKSSSSVLESYLSSFNNQTSLFDYFV